MRRPRVEIEVGPPIDVEALVGGSPTPTPDQIREAADQAMEQLIDLVELVRGEVAEHGRGVIVAGDGSGHR